MLNIFVYQDEKFKKKAHDATRGLKLDSIEYDNIHDHVYLFKKIKDMILSNFENNYMLENIETLELLTKLDDGFSKVSIYFNSRLIYGSKWSKFEKQNKDYFVGAIKYIIEKINEKNKRISKHRDSLKKED